MASIPIADVITTERLPIDAQDIVTKVRLVIAGSPAGRAPEADDTGLRDVSGPWDSETQFPVPLVYEYEAPEHAVYACTRSFALPEGFNPFLPPDHASIPEPSVIRMLNPGTPSAVRDGDPLTFAETDAGVGQQQLKYEYAEATPPITAGIKFRYSMSGAAGEPPMNQRMNVFHYRNDGVVEARVLARNRYLLVDGDGTLVVDGYAVSMEDARGLPLNRGGETLVRTVFMALAAFGNDVELKVSAFYPLILNEDLLLDVAKANIRLPASNPSRVTVSGYVAPDREHTIVGWPGGDFTADVAQHQYELGRTIIDFEQAGAPSGLPAEAIESARERRAATTALVQTANYSLMMGERQ